VLTGWGYRPDRTLAQRALRPVAVALVIAAIVWFYFHLDTEYELSVGNALARGFLATSWLLGLNILYGAACIGLREAYRRITQRSD